MKVLHIVAGDINGGAARGAYWLHLGLKAIDIDSKILTNSNRIIHDKDFIFITNNKLGKLNNLLKNYFSNIFSIFYKNREKNIFSTGILGFDFRGLNEYKEADIIHLHWINNGLVDIKILSTIDKPIVWTIRDMWPFTGGCHYSLECDKYKIGCGNCKQLKSNNHYDLSRFVLSRKKRYFPKHMNIVGISTWISEEAKKSELFKEFNIKKISNNINTKEFFPIDKKIAKNILGINTDKKIILAGAQNINDFYKGFNEYLEAIKLLDSTKYFLCFFGNLDESIIETLNFEYQNFGFLNDTVSLRLLYSASNVFVAPSIMDAFGKTIAEAMACGTPVVCFDATGPRDIVTHKLDGYKAKSFEKNDLENGIKWILNNKSYDKICQSAREKVLQEFDSIIIAKKYIELYKEILND